MKSLSAQKAALTKEIKAQDAHVRDLKQVSARQGDQFSFMFEGRKCERFMYLGEYFFPSTIRKEEKELERLREARKQLDGLKDEVVGVVKVVEVVEEVNEVTEETVEVVKKRQFTKLRVAITYKVQQIEALMATLGANDFKVDFQYDLEVLGMTVEEFDAVLLSLEDFFTMDGFRVILSNGMINILC